MKNGFDIIIERKNTCSIKWDYCESRFGSKEILPMWVADMDFPSPCEVADAIKNRAEHGIYGYTGISDQLTEAVLNWMQKRNNWAINGDWTVHTPGVVTSINTAILAYTDVGDGILIQTPVYHPFYSSILENDRKLVVNPLINKNGYYEIDFDDLDNKLRNGVKMMILCSPHNPVGRVWKTEELKQISQLCNRYHVLIVSDEIHCDLIYRGYKHIPIASISDELLQNSITCISPTKTFNLAGLSESIAIIPNKALRMKFQKTLNRTGAGMLNIFGLEAAKAAYSHGEKWLEEVIDYLSENRDILVTYIKENIPSIKVAKPEGTYLAWLDCREISEEAQKLKDIFIKKAKVGLNEGLMFGKEGEGFQRINFACPRSMLMEGLHRIDNAVRSL